MAMSENEHQEMIFQWAAINEPRCPELRLLYHVPNEGQRNRLYAYALKRRGVKAGVPDLCLPVARGGYHGLYIELKADKGRPTARQAEWVDALARQGYKAAICHGWEQATDMIERYLGLGTCQ